MKHAKQSCIFGPIPSRRLGISLGVDLIPFKTCSMDCIYCECGKTTVLTTERKEYFPTALAMEQIGDALAKHPDIDYITFSGTGEPTLHSGIGTIVAYVKQNFPDVKLCLLTNSAALTDEALSRELASLDLIVPSLDGSTEEEFRMMNRPADGVSLNAVVDGLIRFRALSGARMWLEIFIAKGINDTRESAERFRELVRRIHPDKVQLNTLDRPGTDRNVQIPSLEVLQMMASVIRETAEVELVGGRAAKQKESDSLSTEEYCEKILATIASRPCTTEDLAQTLGMKVPALEILLRQMKKTGRITAESGPRGIYYRAEKSATDSRSIS